MCGNKQELGTRFCQGQDQQQPQPPRNSAAPRLLAPWRRCPANCCCRSSELCRISKSPSAWASRRSGPAVRRAPESHCEMNDCGGCCASGIGVLKRRTSALRRPGEPKPCRWHTRGPAGSASSRFWRKMVDAGSSATSSCGILVGLPALSRRQQKRWPPQSAAAGPFRRGGLWSPSQPAAPGLPGLCRARRSRYFG